MIEFPRRSTRSGCSTGALMLLRIEEQLRAGRLRLGEPINMPDGVGTDQTPSLGPSVVVGARFAHPENGKVERAPNVVRRHAIVMVDRQVDRVLSRQEHHIEV